MIRLFYISISFLFHQIIHKENLFPVVMHLYFKVSRSFS